MVNNAIRSKYRIIVVSGIEGIGEVGVFGGIVRNADFKALAICGGDRVRINLFALDNTLLRIRTGPESIVEYKFVILSPAACHIGPPANTGI